MVESPENPFNGDISQNSQIGLASPKDRLASYIIDSILLLPLVQLFQSPFKRWIIESFAYGEDQNVAGLKMVNMIIFIMVFTIYYTLMTYFGGQTLGKKFFGIRVISYKGKISLLDAFRRSLAILFELSTLGLSFAAIFTHPLRRPIHDRIADTLVISHRSPVGYPSNGEKFKTYAVVLSAFIFLSFASVIYSLIGIDLEEEVMQASEFSRPCETEMEESDSSLIAGIELFMTEKISNECLFNHARNFLWNDEDVDLAHLAIALSFIEDVETSSRYLDEICSYDEKGRPCQFTQWLSKGFPLQDDFVKEIEEGEGVHNFYKVYLSSVYVNKGKFKEGLSLLQGVSKKSLLSPHVAKLSFKGLLNLERWDEAFWVFRSSSSVDHLAVASYVEKSLKNETMSSKKLLGLLLRFYPELNSHSSQGRGIASTADVNEDILALYYILKEGI